MSEHVINVRGLGKRYRVWTRSRPTNLKERLRESVRSAPLRSERTPPWRDIWALRDVTFDVERGEVLGVIGPNGAGKSTLLTILARITEPSEGWARISGRVSSLLEVGTGFHGELSGRDNVFLNGAVLGMSRAETERKFDEIVEFSGIGDFIDIPVKRYSTGMYVRLAFAVAAHLDPEILLLDEVLAVGDQEFQEKCLARIDEMTQAGRTVLFVSHAVASVARLCRRAILVRDGRIEFAGDVDEAIERYLVRRATEIGGGSVEEAEREGTGEARFTEVRVTNVDGGDALYPDRPIVIHLGLEAERPLPGTNLDVAVDIGNPAGAVYVTVATRFDRENRLDHAVIHGQTRLRCTLDELPFKPGNYVLSVALTRLGEVIDRVPNQVEFTLLPSDYFGTGVFPQDYGPPILVRHRWDLDAQPRHLGAVSPSTGSRG